MAIDGKQQQRVAIYARVSSQEQATEGVSIEAQVAALKAYSKSQGWEIADEYIDGGFSGSTDDRPALKRLLIDAGRRRFSIIAVCKLDRFFRNLRLLLNHLHDLEQLGIKFVSTQEGLDTSTPYGKFAVQIMGVIAEFERGRIGERVKDSRKYLIAQDNWPGGRMLYGYRWLAKKKQWEVVPEEAKIVRLIYDLYGNRRMGFEAVATTLNKNGLRTRDGASWRLGTVRSILTHPGYQGQHQIGIQMPAIIDENIWQLAQQRREKARSVLADPMGWLLQGICFCGQCGHVLKCQQKRPGEARYYACRGRVQHRVTKAGGERCNLPYVRADWLEQGVWEKVKELLNNSNKLAECVNRSLIKLEERREKIGAESMAFESKLEVVRAKQERLGIAFSDGAVNETVYKSKLKRLKKEEELLLKCQHNIDPIELGEIVNLGIRIDMVKDVLNKGSLLVTDLGIFGEMGDMNSPAQFNVSEEHASELVPGETAEDDAFVTELTDMVVRNMGETPSLPESEDPQKKQEAIIRNRRDILQLFNIKAIVYPERVEITGMIPIQILDKKNKEENKTAPIITSASPSTERGIKGEVKSAGGYKKKEGSAPLLDAPIYYRLTFGEDFPDIYGKVLALFIAGNDLNLLGGFNAQPQLRRPFNLVLLEDFPFTYLGSRS